MLRLHVFVYHVIASEFVDYMIFLCEIPPALPVVQRVNFFLYLVEYCRKLFQKTDVAHFLFDSYYERVFIDALALYSRPIMRFEV